MSPRVLATSTRTTREPWRGIIHYGLCWRERIRCQPPSDASPARLVERASITHCVGVLDDLPELTEGPAS